MVTIDEGKAVVIGGWSNEDQNDQDALQLITCGNRNCNSSKLDYTLSRARKNFVAIPLPETAECTLKPTNQPADPMDSLGPR